MAARDASEETIRIGYWNITSINSQRNHETGKLVNRQRIISDIMDKENIDIMVCLDSKKPKNGFDEETLNRGYGWGTVDKRTTNARMKKVAFWTGPRTDNAVDVNAVDDNASTIVIFKKHFCDETNRNLKIRSVHRMPVVSFKSKVSADRFHLICCYAPVLNTFISEANQTKWDSYFRQMTEAAKARVISDSELVAICGDLNVDIDWNGGGQDNHSSRRVTLNAFCRNHHFELATLHEEVHKTRRRKTYKHYNDTESYLDHFMIGKKNETARPSDLVGPRGVVREIEVTDYHLTDSSYHRLCIATLVLKLPKMTTEGKVSTTTKSTTAGDEFEKSFSKLEIK